MATTFELSVTSGDRRISVTVTRKRVKNLNLRVRSDGAVTLSIPARASVKTAEEFLARRASWIAEHLDRQERRRSNGTPLAAGEIPSAIPLWGTLVNTEAILTTPSRFQHTLDIKAALRPNSPEQRDGITDEPAIAPAFSYEEYTTRVRALYRSEIARALPSIVERLEAEMDVHATRWSIRHMRTRWGSCTPRTGAIRIALGLAAYPRECLEFVVAHELVHLMEPSHNARFHALLDTYCPNNRAAAALLKRPAADVTQQDATRSDA